MQIAGLGPRDVLGVVRGARETAASHAPIVVTGILATELARALRGGDDAGGSVRVSTDAADAAALVVVLGGAPTAADEEAMRTAARASTPVVAVQTDSRWREPLAYVPAEATVVCEAGKGFPVAEIARVIAAQSGEDSVSLAARVPAIRDEIVDELIRTAALRAAVIGALPWRKGADFPALTLIQARLVLDVAAAHGRTIDRERAPELAAVAASGLGLRAAVRRLPRRIPLLGGVTGFLATRALGEAARRRFAAGG